jgi:hypothetical protein
VVTLIPNEMTFRQQLLLTIIDKALIGLLIAVAGFWLNRYLEAFKSRQSLQNELKKVRDQKQIELLEARLSHLYWPVYLHLQMDNVVWERILERKSQNPIKAALAAQIEKDFILPNHEAACQIIKSNIHLADLDPQLIEILLKYVRHVAVYRAIRATGNTETDPLDVGEPWPYDVFPAIEKATLLHQKEFQTLLKQHSQ